MKGKLRIRDALVSDAKAILEIYAPFVRDTITSYEYNVPSVEEMERRIATTVETHPYLVCEEEDERILGYAYAGPHRSREGYQWIAETSIYMAPQARGQGIGSFLYSEMFRILEELGYYHVFMGISGSNPQSEAFHQKFGFVKMATFKNFGCKFGQWIDATTYYLKELRPTEGVSNPKVPLKYPEWKTSVNK